MSKLFKRFLAYTIDMMVILLITQSLSGVPFINKQLDTYNKYYDKYVELFEEYGNFKVDLTNDFKDKKLSEKEYNNLIENHENYQDILNQVYEDKELTKKEYNKINKEIDKEYEKEYKKLYFKIEQNLIAYFIIYLVTVFAYFVLFNKFTNGQTLGKKLTRLKIVNAKDTKEEVTILSYIIRAIILYQPIYYIAKLIGISTLDMNSYNTLTSIFYDIQYYLEILIIIMIMLRIDGRGPHDLLAKTKVILLDRNGNEVEDKMTTMIKQKKEIVKNKKKPKIIDEPSNE